MTGERERLRLCQPADHRRALALVHGTLGGTPYEDRVVELLSDAAGESAERDCVVLEHGDKLTALALMGRVSGARDVWKIHAILVAAAEPFREIGDVMLDSLLMRARERRARMIVAELPGDTPFGDMLSLLRANDFDQVGRIADFYRDGVALLILSRHSLAG